MWRGFLLLLTAPPPSAALPSSTRCLPSRSQFGEEAAVAAAFFANQSGGVFVEIGALNGLLNSNTLMLETCANWSGVLIEANPANVPHLKHNVERYRPRSKVVASAVCEPPASEITMATHGMSGKGGGGPGNEGISADLRFAAPAFLQSWHRPLLNESLDVEARTLLAVRVPCRPMRSLVAGLSHIDFLSVDVEGAEIEVLRTLDFDTVAVDVLLVEMGPASFHPRASEVVTLLCSRGYRPCASPVLRWSVAFSAHCTSARHKDLACSRAPSRLTQVVPGKASKRLPS